MFFLSYSFSNRKPTGECDYAVDSCYSYLLLLTDESNQKQHMSSLSAKQTNKLLYKEVFLISVKTSCCQKREQMLLQNY